MVSIWKKLIEDSADRELKAVSEINSTEHSSMESGACKTNHLGKPDFNLLIFDRITSLIR